MSIVKLTKNLENFKWTNYSSAGDNNSSITRDREGAKFNTPQTFYDGHSKVVTGKQTFNRPDKGALEDMESKFGPFTTQPNSRGPYNVSDYMWGRQVGRGFTAPGQAPLGFTVDMQSLTADVKSEIEIDGDLSLTPLSYVIAGVNSALDYGGVPSSMISTIPSTPGAYGVNVVPISTYSSRILARPELEGFTSAPVGGRGVSYYGRLESVYNQSSMFQKDDGTYTTPIGQSTAPGFQTEFQNFMEFGGRGFQRTFEIPREYPNNTTAYSIDSQISSNWESPMLKPSGYGVFPSVIPIGPLEVRFDTLWKASSGTWPYNILGYTQLDKDGGTIGTPPLITKQVGQRIPIGGGYDWMALQATRTADDITRIESWLDTPKGQLWQDKQHILQELNPREETRDWSKSNLTLSIPPLIHATRHFGGETYMERADFGPLIDGDAPAGTSIGGLVSGFLGGTKYGKTVGKIATKVGDLMEKVDSAIGGAVAGLDSALGGIDFNEVGGRLQFLTDKMIKQIPDTGGFGSAITNMRSAHSPLGRPPKVPTQTTFSQKGAYGIGDAHKETVENRTGNTLQSYKGVAYGSIGKVKYDGPASPFYVDEEPIKPEYIDFAPRALPDFSKLDSLASKLGPGLAQAGFAKSFNAISQFDAMTDKYNEDVPNKEETDALIEAWDFNRTRPVNKLGNPGSKGLKTVGDTEKGDRGGVGLGLIKKNSATPDSYKTEATDLINMIPYGKDYNEMFPGTDDSANHDFIKFKFKDIVNDKFIIFRAILSGISDSITPEWTGTRYIGRPDQVYTYKGAERKVSFSFEIFPKTKQEFPILMEKLNYLIGLCYPSFTPGKRMVAPFINLTLGDMFNNTPGFLDSLSVSVDDNSPWEIDPYLQYPHHITCECSFTYIGKYMPSTLGKHYELHWLKDHGWKTGDSEGKGATFGTFIAADQKDESTGKYPMKDQPERQSFRNGINMDKLMATERDTQ